MRKWSLSFALLAACALAAPSAAQELPQRVLDAGKLVIATNPNYAPITYKDPATDRLTGFDIDLGESLAAELGVEAAWEEIAFAQMLPSLQTGRVDMVLAGMSDLPSRREIVDFVDYLASGAQFYTSAALSAEIASPADLCGKAVGASRSTNWPNDIAAWSEANCVAQGLPAIEVVGTEGSVDARTQIKSQRLQGAVQGSETLPYFQALEPGTYVLLGEPFTTSLAGMPFLKTEEGAQLREAVAAALGRLLENGTYAALLEKHGLTANGVETVMINQGG